MLPARQPDRLMGAPALEPLVLLVLLLVLSELAWLWQPQAPSLLVRLSA